MSRRLFIHGDPLMSFLVGSVVLGTLATWLLVSLPAAPGLLPLLAVPISYIPALLAILLLRAGGSLGERRVFWRRLTQWRGRTARSPGPIRSWAVCIC
jgi:hypothetical protein